MCFSSECYGLSFSFRREIPRFCFSIDSVCAAKCVRNERKTFVCTFQKFDKASRMIKNSQLFRIFTAGPKKHFPDLSKALNLAPHNFARLVAIFIFRSPSNHD